MNELKLVIYMADDDADDRYFMRQALEKTDPLMTIIEAQDGEELLALLDTWSQQPAPRPVHLILLDVNMPKMNGLEALRAIRSNPLLCHIPTVMISTSAESEQVTMACQDGATEYIKKPVSYSQIDQIAQAVSVRYLKAAAN